MAKTDEPRATRWWRQAPVRLSLRALLVLVLVLACGLGWLVNSAQVQREAIAAIEKAGGRAYYGWQLRSSRSVAGFQDLTPLPNSRPRWPKWITDWVGPDYYSRVWLVMVPGPADPVMPHVGRLTGVEELDFYPGRKGRTLGPTDAGMVHLRGLTRLKQLKLGVHVANGEIGSQITGKGLAEIASATGLQYLDLAGIPLADADLEPLRRLTDLRYLHVEGPDLTDAGLERLSGLVQLRKLIIQKSRLTAAGMVHLRSLAELKDLSLPVGQLDRLEPFRSFPRLRTLALPDCPIHDPGLVAGQDPGFVSLVVLNLTRTQIGDAGLMRLKDLPKLKTVFVNETKVTDAGAAEFEKDMPGVVVVRKKPTFPTRPPRTPAAK